MGGVPHLREAIRRAYRRDESECVAALAAEYQGARGDCAAVASLAQSLVEAVRHRRSGASGVGHLMHEFSLSSQEGIALMCLAEALLRIPDAATADRLIRDKIAYGDWRAHLGHSPSLFVNAATWGLMLTGKLVAIHDHGVLGEALTRLLRRGGEPLIRRAVDFAMRLLGEQFVMGESIGEALARAQENEARGYVHSFDMLGEAALTAADAERYGAAYVAAIRAIGEAGNGRGVRAGPGISVKLSALHPRYVRSQRERVMAELLPRLLGLAKLAREFDIGLNIDAEEADRLEMSLDLLAALAAAPELAGWEGLGFVVQAYQKRCPFVIDWLAAVARRHERRLMVRLVKGAYWDTEIKRAQVDGLTDYPVFTRKVHTDVSYLASATRLLASADVLYPQFATHNAQTLAAVHRMAEERAVEDYEFQCLHGMGEPLYDNVVGTDYLARRCRIYAPVGSHETLLPYLVRRLLENGANSSFVNRIVDDAVPVTTLVEDPLDRLHREGGTRHPSIPLPPDLYGPDRRNSAGLDLSDEDVLAVLDADLAALAEGTWEAQPLVAGRQPAGGRPKPVSNPAQRVDIVGTVREADTGAVAAALGVAEAFAPAWYATLPAERAAALLRAAVLFEEERPALVSLCIREAGKTRGNAVAEVREAVDFCRYYAAQLLRGAPPGSAEAPGLAVCISPWNFPLAIFVGQVSAALAAGSPVLAKPAEQTPLVAALAVGLLHQAGIPSKALHFLPGRGETVGAALVADPRVHSILFTGSTEVARHIARSIAGRPGVRLIAETGGQNAMIVDSSALAEQVVQDALVSGFDSAGQRCSALRVLCLQADIADRVLVMLRAAMAELVVGDPADIATDVGPVIDEDALERLLAHVAAMRARGRRVFQLPLPEAGAGGCFLPPTLIEIESLAELEWEVFGPVIHVLRFAAGDLDALVAAINATGYGLTLGLHSRIDESVRQVIRSARVGNLYVNRNMVGAVVGVQPFGGEGLSGTGPKAGGPLYLHRLAGSEVVLPGDLGCGETVARLDVASPFRCLAEWAFASGRSALAGLCTRYAELMLPGREIDLPGPTGEQNSLAFSPRGDMLCLGSDEDVLLAQLAAVLASGNGVLVDDTAVVRQLLAKLPQPLAAMVSLRSAEQWSALAGVLVAGGDAEAAAVRQRLTDEPGPLVPVYEAGRVSGLYPLHRMVVERVVSVNTTAAGGNTTLMTLGA